MTSFSSEPQIGKLFESGIFQNIHKVGCVEDLERERVRVSIVSLDISKLKHILRG